MKKRISLLIGALALTLSFAGCGNKKELEYNEEQLTYVTQFVIANFEVMDAEQFEHYRQASEYQINKVMSEANAPIEPEVLISMMDAWEAAEKECGEYVEHGEYQFESSNSGVVVSTEAVYEEREATLEFKFDENLDIESLDIAADYTTGEILKKAGMNTILGMGTVFLVLIFLAFVISLLKYIPALQEKFTKKKARQEELEALVSELPKAEPPVEEELSDDEELVAVITAAIAAADESVSDGFVVRSIRRRKSNKWN